MTCCTTYRRIQSGEAAGLGAGLARGALSVLAVPYRLTSALLEIVKTGQGGVDTGVPTISVGNITCGGTGKTPVVELIVKTLQAKGRRPVILSRGYKAEDDGVNDEARMLARKFPGVIHLQGKDRVELAKHASGAQLGDSIVLDDGFQYHGVARDLNVCCIDVTNPFGYGEVLPRGLLREPLSSLYRARPVLLTRTELATPGQIAEIRAEVLRHNEHALIVESEMRTTSVTDVNGDSGAGPSSIAGKRVLLASGVGSPDSFERTVRRTGARVVGHDERGDHHAWDADDVTRLVSAATAGHAEYVLTTEKDAVKLARLSWPDGAPPLRVLAIEAVVTEGTELWNDLIDEALKRG